MNLFAAEIVDIDAEDSATVAKVRVGGVFVRVSLQLLPEARIGDEILIAGGVALARVDGAREKELSDVLGHSRKSAGH